MIYNNIITQEIHYVVFFSHMINDGVSFQGTLPAISETLGSPGESADAYLGQMLSQYPDRKDLPGSTVKVTWVHWSQVCLMTFRLRLQT